MWGQSAQMFQNLHVNSWLGWRLERYFFFCHVVSLCEDAIYMLQNFWNSFPQVIIPEYQATHDGSQWRCHPGCPYRWRHLNVFPRDCANSLTGVGLLPKLILTSLVHISAKSDSHKTFLRTLLFQCLLPALCFRRQTSRSVLRVVMHRLFPSSGFIFKYR